LPHGERVSLGGMVRAIKYSHVKNGRDADAPTKYVMFDLEDVEGTIRTIVWPSQFTQQGQLVQTDTVLIAQGRIDRNRGDEANLVVDRLIPLEQLDQQLTTGIRIRLDEQIHSTAELKKTYEIVRGYPGHRALELELILSDGTQVRLVAHKTKIEINDQVCGRLRELLGSAAVEMQVDRKMSGKSSNGVRNGRSNR
jgi:DNA polymerase-3 subunit alpha